MTLITSAHDPHLWPEGRIPGCLPRSSKVGAVCPLASERIKLIPEADWAELAKTNSMEAFMPFVHDQNGYGSCATESTSEAIEGTEAFAGKDPVLLNALFIYYHSSGGRDGGSSIDDNLVIAREKGCASEAVWSRDHGFRTKPSEEAYADALLHRIDEFYDVANVREAVSALLQDYLLVWGAKGHSVLKIAYDKDLNSWGRSWGDNGKGLWAPVTGINWAYGAFAVRTTRGR